MFFFIVNNNFNIFIRGNTYIINKEPENVIKNILKVFNIFQKFIMPNPGLEPGSPAWKAEIIPIDQFGFNKKSKGW